MDKEALSALAQRMIAATREFVGKAETAIMVKMGEVNARIDAIPEPQAGPDGATGPAGEQGEPGERGEDGAQGDQGEQGETGAPGETGENGADGAQGDQGITTPDHVVAALVASHVQSEVDKLPKAKDGEDGRDAADLIVLPSIDENQSYRRGTWASHNGGLIQSVRATDPIEDGDLTNAGWCVIVEGIAAHMVTPVSTRSFEVACKLTSGLTTISSFTIPSMIYKDIWKEGEYEHGDVVTWAGSSWHCQTDTTDKPGTSDEWRLMVKRGVKGKDGDQPPAAKKVVRTK